MQGPAKIVKYYTKASRFFKKSFTAKNEASIIIIKIIAFSIHVRRQDRYIKPILTIPAPSR